jgi:hypothetical protein
MAHEIGHTQGLGDCTACTDGNQSIMFGGLPPYVGGHVVLDCKGPLTVWVVNAFLTKQEK